MRRQGYSLFQKILWSHGVLSRQTIACTPTVTDVEHDYDAVMSSKESPRRIFREDDATMLGQK